MTGSARGFSLIEVLFALTLLTIVSTTLTTSLIQALRARATSRDLLQATQIAADSIERWRGGFPQPAADAGTRFERRIAVSAFAPEQGLHRIDVTVSWNDGRPHELTLSTVLPQ